jgi:hypothetical protein
VAEYILIERVKDEVDLVALPPPSDALAVDEIHIEPEDLSRLVTLHNDLEQVETNAPLNDFVPAVDFQTSSYRLTLLSLLNHSEQLDVSGSVAELAKQPFTMELDESVVEVSIPTTPALWFLAPITLIFPEGEMDLLPIRNILALPPSSIISVLQVKGNLSCWRVLENRTSFERVAKHVRPGEGVLWVPGFAPSWWLNAVAHLISLCPAPLHIACDPDPAGVMIATIVSRVWIDNTLPWQPWGMSPEIAEKMPQKKPLSEYDKQQTEELLANSSISSELRRLLIWMQGSGMKVEQEGIPFEDLM